MDLSECLVKLLARQLANGMNCYMGLFFLASNFNAFFLFSTFILIVAVHAPPCIVKNLNEDTWVAYVVRGIPWRFHCWKAVSRVSSVCPGEGGIPGPPRIRLSPDGHGVDQLATPAI